MSSCCGVKSDIYEYQSHNRTPKESLSGLCVSERFETLSQAAAGIRVSNIYVLFVRGGEL